MLNSLELMPLTMNRVLDANASRFNLLKKLTNKLTIILANMQTSILATMLTSMQTSISTTNLTTMQTSILTIKLTYMLIKFDEFNG